MIIILKQKQSEQLLLNLYFTQVPEFIKLITIFTNLIDIEL